MRKESESHKPQFRGVFIPADIFYLFSDGKISPLELILLVTIDSLVSPAEGCWASNRFLADRIGCEPRHVQRLISNLTDKELIVQVGWKVTPTGRVRVMETKWSRVSQPRKKPDKGRGGHDRQVVGGHDRQVVGGHDRQVVGGHDRQVVGGHDRQVAQVYSSSKNMKRDAEFAPRTSATPSKRHRLSVSERAAQQGRSAAQYDKRCRTGATLLRESLRKNNRQVRGRVVEKWEHALHLLDKEVGRSSNWSAVLAQYCQYLSEKRMRELKREGVSLPFCGNCAEFRKHYEWIKGALAKIDEDFDPSPRDKKPLFSIYED